MSSASRSIAVLALLAASVAAQELVGRVDFFGNHYLTDTDLLEIVREVLGGAPDLGFRRSGIDDAAYAIERAYQREGFCFADVRYTYHESGSTVLATVIVIEGPQAYIADIEIDGVRSLDEALVKATFVGKREGRLGFGLPLFEMAHLDPAAKSIEDAYVNQGFRNVVVERPLVSYALDGPDLETGLLPVTIHLSVDEGTQFVLRGIEFLGTGLSGPVKEAIEADFLGRPSVGRLTDELRTRVQRELGELGHRRAEVSVTETVTETGDSRLQVQLQPGPIIVVGDVSVEGNLATDEELILERFPLRSGQVFDQEAEEDGFRDIFASGLFRRVRIEPTYRGDTADLVIRVVEGDRREFRLSFGGGSLDIVRGGAEVFDRSIFGSGTAVSLGGRISLIEAAVEASWSSGRLFSDWEARVLATYRQTRRSFLDRDETRTELRLSYPLETDLYFSIGLRFKHVVSLDDVDELAVFGEPLFDEYSVVSIFSAVTLDSRKPFPYPERGFLVIAGIEFGSRYFGGDVDVFRTVAQFRWYARLWPDATLALRVENSIAIPIDESPSLPIPERLFTGGHDTVRSFKDGELGPIDPHRNPVGGEVTNLFGIEIRQRVYGNLYLAIFGEAGNAALVVENPFDDFRPSVGVGVRYALPIGPLRLDVGFNPDAHEHEDDYRLHFNIGQPF